PHLCSLPSVITLPLFFNHTPTPEISTLSLHDALPIWPSTYISPLSNSTPCIRKDRISSKSLMRLSICLWKPSIKLLEEILSFRIDRKSGSAGMPRPISYAVFCLKKKKQTRRLEPKDQR